MEQQFQPVAALLHEQSLEAEAHVFFWILRDIFSHFISAETS